MKNLDTFFQLPTVILVMVSVVVEDVRVSLTAESYPPNSRWATGPYVYRASQNHHIIIELKIVTITSMWKRK